MFPCSWVPTSHCHLWTLWVLGRLETPQVSVSPTYVKWGRPANPATLPVRSGCQVKGRAWNPAVSCCPSCSVPRMREPSPFVFPTSWNFLPTPLAPSSFLLHCSLLLIPSLCVFQSGGGLSLLSYLCPVNIRQVAIPRQAVHQAQGLDPGERRVCILFTSK